MNTPSIQNATLLGIAMATIAAGTQLTERSVVGGIFLVIVGIMVPFAREFLKDYNKKKEDDCDKKKK